MRNFLGAMAIFGAAVTGLVLSPSRAEAVPVGLELSLLLDVSTSVDATEYNLQLQGYVDAFNSVAVQTAIANTAGGIAVNMIQWSSATSQQQVQAWTHLTGAASAGAFATAISGIVRAFNGNTAPGSAINFAVPLFNGNGFEGARKVIDVSGDGAENQGANTAAASAAATTTGGINAINGLPIGDATLQAWYAANIQAGPNSFTTPATTFNDFSTAIQAKLYTEITNTVTPEPASLALIGTALLGLGALRRRRQAA